MRAPSCDSISHLPLTTSWSGGESTETATESAGAEAEGEEAEGPAATATHAGKAWAKRSHMFPKYSVIGTTKKVSFRRAKDLAAVLYYDATNDNRLPEGTRCVGMRLCA